MDTPIDYRTYTPSKDKYLDEETMEFARWILFGEHLDESVDIHWATGGMDIVIALPLERAIQLIRARNKFCDEVVRIMNSTDEDIKRNECWD